MQNRKEFLKNAFLALGGLSLPGFLPQLSAAQTVPVLGAVAGATINYHFTRYYQEIARVHFGLLRLSQETGIPREALIEALELRMNQLRPGRKSLDRG